MCQINFRDIYHAKGFPLRRNDSTNQSPHQHISTSSHQHINMFLNCHSYFSLRYGTLPVEELVEAAHQHGIGSLALTDINNSTGVPDFVKACRQAGIKPITGIEFRDDDKLLYVGIARNREGMRELNELLTHHNISATPLPERPLKLDNCFIMY